MSEPPASSPLVSPIELSAVYSLTDLDALDAIYDGGPGFIYARDDGHPNAVRLSNHLAKLEGAAWGLVAGSGIGAIALALLATVSSGERVIASRSLYGTTSKLLHTELSRYGVQTEFVECGDLEAVKVALERPARVVLVETISNPLCRVVDLPALAVLAHRNGARLIVDNTFATPVLSRPLDLGADLVIESLTKFIGGHSDLFLGFLGGRDQDLLATAKRVMSTWGLTAHPFDCWLAERGLATLELRVRTAVANAAALADWLAARPSVSRVIYPGRNDHPDAALARRQFSHGHGHMLCFELAGGREAVNRFMRAAPGIPFCPSLGHIRTTCSHPDSTSHRSVEAVEKRRQGITEGLIRLSVGCEPLAEIQAELARGLS